jgi:hypothetical protein
MESFTQAMVGNLIRHFGIDFTSDIWAGIDLPKYYFGGDTYIV